MTDFLDGKVGCLVYLLGKDTSEMITLKDNKNLTIIGDNE